MRRDSEIADVTIIGAGPTGLFGSFYAGMRQMTTKIIESLPEVGGQVAVLYPEKFIYDVPGYPKILAKDLVQLLLEQATQWQPTLCLDERVEALDRLADGTFLLTSNVREHLSRTVVVAAGVGAFSPNRLDRPGAIEYEGRGVYYFLKSKAPLLRKRLLIVGGGDSAVDWALNLKDWASQVTLIHRRDGFRAVESSVAALMTSPVDVRLWWEVSEIHGDGNRVVGATIFNNKTGETQEIAVDAVLFNLGFKAALGPIIDWGLNLQDKSVVVDGRMATNIPGVFAAGDITHQPDSVQLNLIATGFGQAAIAVNGAKAFMDPSAKVFPGHSSAMRLH